MTVSLVRLMNFSWIQAALLAVVMALGLAGETVAQTTVAQPQPNVAAAKTAKPMAPAQGSLVGASISWTSLSQTQHDALAPLATSWTNLTEGQQRKWIAIAQNFSNLAPTEREKLHGRMADWAALSPKDRERARLNFAQTKKVEPEKRAAEWEAYQALSPEERKALADGAKKKPAGAATAPKPVAPDKLATVPVTRRSSETKREAVVGKTPLDRNTLLPKSAVATAQSPASAPAKP